MIPAEQLARRGWHVFPCLPGDKRPAVDRWEQRACADPDQVAQFWPSPAHNTGVACGPSRLVVLDLDTHGQLPAEWQLPGMHDGRDVLAQLCEWARQPWPSTYMVATPSGGWHLYFRAPDGSGIRNSASLIGPQIDVRAAGGYVVGAGSIDGKPYEVLDDRSPVPLPCWIARMLTRQPDSPRLPSASTEANGTGQLSGLVRTVQSAPEGQRNDALYWAACRAAAELDGASPGTATAALLGAALEAGLTEREALRTIESAMRGAR